jgi:hypothetical protein
MKKLALILLTATSLVGTAGVASAQGYGGGYYPGGPDPYYRDRYRERYYDDDRYYRRGYGYGGGAIVGHDRYGRQELYYPVRPGGRCPPHYTVQDGICKPYRGY